MKPERKNTFSRLERVWFGVGMMLFGVNSVPVPRRPLPNTTSQESVKESPGNENATGTGADLTKT